MVWADLRNGFARSRNNRKVDRACPGVVEITAVAEIGREEGGVPVSGHGLRDLICGFLL